MNTVTDKSGVAFLVRGWVIVFACALTLYVVTLAPDLTWQDQGDYQYQVARCNLNRPGDVVRVHPLFIVVSHFVGRLGIFSYARSASLVSAVFTSVSVANVYLLVCLLCASRFSAVLSAGVFALAHSVWFTGVQPQTYSMANAAISGGLLLVLGYLKTNRVWFLYLMGFVFGLGVSVHMMSQVGFAVIMIWLFVRLVRRKLSFGTIAGIVLCWVAGAFLLWVVMAIEYKRTGDLSGTFASAIWGRWGQEVFNASGLSVLVKRSVQFFVLNFPTPLVLLAIPGIWLSIKRLEIPSAAWLLITCTFAYALFAVRYDVRNQNHFFLPMYMLVSVYVGLGFAFVVKKKVLLCQVTTVLLVLAIVPAYLGISGLARAKQISLGTRRHIPYRDVYEYYLLPWQQGQNGPRRLVTDVFDKLPAGAALLADSTVFPAFQYAHEIENQRPDIQLLKKHSGPDMIESDRMFTICDVEGYYPSWVKSQSWLKPFAISEEANIFEIIVNSDQVQ